MPDSEDFTPSSHPGILHAYAPNNLTAFEHTPTPNIPHPSHVLLLCPGLGDGLLSNPFFAHLSTVLPDYACVEVGLTSSYKGWATSSVEQDAKELLLCARYFRNLRGANAKIVLLGHSTGCQDVVHLFTRLSKDKVQEASSLINAAVLLSPVSDHDWIRHVTPENDLELSLKEAEKYIDAGEGSKVLQDLPTAGFHDLPITAQRWASLAGSLTRFPWGEDYFGEGLNEEQMDSVWGEMGRSGLKRLCILAPGEDQYYFSEVSIQDMTERWAGMVRKAGADVEVRIVPGADHSFRKRGVDVLGGQALKGYLDRL